MWNLISFLTSFTDYHLPHLTTLDHSWISKLPFHLGGMPVPEKKSTDLFFKFWYDTDKARFVQVLVNGNCHEVKFDWSSALKNRIFRSDIYIAYWITPNRNSSEVIVGLGYGFDITQQPLWLG
jgi:hypothetical protein